MPIQLFRGPWFRRYHNEWTPGCLSHCCSPFPTTLVTRVSTGCPLCPDHRFKPTTFETNHMLHAMQLSLSIRSLIQFSCPLFSPSYFRRAQVLRCQVEDVSSSTVPQAKQYSRPHITALSCTVTSNLC
ncbi:hypothetical protein BDR04DRAFT_118073 [Suillus decipiens]|nr:hypothetical protein BDR04DRAFT_118073 [Suillus decipiens]